MVDSVACCRLRLATVPTVGCDALLDLKALLRCASFPDSDVVLQGIVPCFFQEVLMRESWAE
jgi:hypothetical protein